MDELTPQCMHTNLTEHIISSVCVVQMEVLNNASIACVCTQPYCKV